MESNPYAAPQAHLETPLEQQSTFYVVGIAKFSILFIATFGLYVIYWFYANWKGYKEHTKENLWPIARGIFSIFFAHSLFAKVQDKIDAENRDYKWSPGALATAYVIFAVASNVLDRMSMREVWSPFSDVLSIVMVIPLFFTVLAAQKAVNFAEGDVAGTANSTLTWANYIWVAIGVLWWLLVGFGLLIITGLIAVDA